MRIVSFHSSESPASSRPSLGALLPGDREILDFCAEASGVPQPGAHLAWFTREGASFRAARELHDAVLADDAKAGELRGAGAIVAHPHRGQTPASPPSGSDPHATPVGV